MGANRQSEESVYGEETAVQVGDNIDYGHEHDGIGSPNSDVMRENVLNEDFDLVAEEERQSDDEPPLSKGIEGLRRWAVSTQISHTHLEQLFLILRERILPDLPKTAVTFLGTRHANYNIRSMGSSTDGEPGEFVYFGIATGLEKCLAGFHEGDINLIFNVDGLPLSKSGKTSFWPILCKIYYEPDVYKPFEVAIYAGAGKPKDSTDFFEDLINELNTLHRDGFRLDDKIFKVNWKALPADTPARAFCRGTKGHGGYCACERCTVYGTPIKVGPKKTQIVYPGVDHPKRSNMSFRERLDPEHHVGNSPFEQIEQDIDITTIFPLDFMHLACVGAMRKILEMLVSGPLKVRMNLRSRHELSRRLISFKAQMPKEFQRKMRSIACVFKWKATEFRFFLLYCGPIVLKNLLPENLYNHFLLLHASFRILCNETLAPLYKEKARKYLNLFVLSVPILYGEQAQTINIHNLCHVVDDVENMGCDLSKINCFPFESHLGTMKRSIRTPNRPLVQFCRRHYEKSIVSRRLIEIPSKFQIGQKYLENEEVIVKNFIFNYSTFIGTRTPDNVVLLHNGYVAEIKRIFGRNESEECLYIEAKVWKKKQMYSRTQQTHQKFTNGELPQKIRLMLFILSRALNGN